MGEIHPLHLPVVGPADFEPAAAADHVSPYGSEHKGGLISQDKEKQGALSP